LDGVEGNSFNVIRSEITACYEKLEGAHLSQEEICEEMATWILDKTGMGTQHKTAGKIIVSFFVQNCSIFRNLRLEVPAEIDIQVQV